ncbi:MAG TPA: GNAT family N-acetyltransferase [Solirubrobacteraceae bacterium]|nr:GNAT family N-acetyltransferase [Solirubrobacteraceae bacterium]
MSHRIEPLADGHDLDTFTCGHPDLDQWLRLHAHQATRQGTRTYLLVEGGSDAVIGYFAIAPHTLARDEAPRRIGRGSPRAIPAILLAKLALDRRFQGQGLGDELLVYALTKIVTAARAAGGKLVVVDAIDETAASFYRTHSFQPSPADPLRLAMKLSTAARELELPWP